MGYHAPLQSPRYRLGSGVRVLGLHHLQPPPQYDQTIPVPYVVLRPPFLWRQIPSIDAHEPESVVYVSN